MKKVITVFVLLSSTASAESKSSLSLGASFIGLSLNSEYFFNRDQSIQASFEAAAAITYGVGKVGVGPVFYGSLDEYSKVFISPMLSYSEMELSDLHAEEPEEEVTGGGLDIQFGYVFNIEESSYTALTASVGMYRSEEKWQAVAGMPFLKWGIMF